MPASLILHPGRPLLRLECWFIYWQDNETNPLTWLSLHHPLYKSNKVFPDKCAVEIGRNVEWEMMWEDIQIFLPDPEWRGQEQELGVYYGEYGDDWLTRVSPSTSLPSALTNWMSSRSVHVINEKLVRPESSPHTCTSTTDEMNNEIIVIVVSICSSCYSQLTIMPISVVEEPKL